MKGKIWIGGMSEADKALAFRAVQKLDSFYGKRTVDQYDCFFIRKVGDVWNGGNIDYYKECESQEITLQQLLKLAGMEENMSFTKADLVAGKHVVECANKNKYLVTVREDGTLFGLNLNRDSYLPLDGHDSNLEYRSKDLSISAVYEMGSFNTFLDLNKNLKPIWKRTEKSETQIQLEKLQQQIADLQAQANELQATL